MADSFFGAYTKHAQKPPENPVCPTDGADGQPAGASDWLKVGATPRPDTRAGQAGSWFDDPALMAAAGSLHALASKTDQQKHGIIMNSVTRQADMPAELPVQSPLRQAAHKAMHFLAVGAPPVFIALLTPWVWLDWSLPLYLETAGSVIAGLGAATFVTSGVLARKRRRALAEQRYASLSPEQQARAVTIDQALDRLEQRGRQCGDAAIAAPIQRITDAIRSVLPVLVADKGSDAELYYTLRQTAFDYLPSTLEAYQRIPADAAQHESEAGQTPRELLLEQLQLLEENIGRLVAQVTENGREALQANGRFLQERFRFPDSAAGSTPQVTND
jgi:hypothetical protein